MNALGKSTPRERNDCVVRALSNASGMAYDEAYEICAAAGRKPGGRMMPDVWVPLMKKHVGIERSEFLSSFKTVSSLSKHVQKRGGSYLVLVRGHVAVNKDGHWLDWLDSHRKHRVLSVWKICSKEAA